MTKEKLSNLLNQTNLILKHQKEKEILKGESFNVFSVLGMERKENATHSAFLCELLNPKGSHLMGTTFLQLFLQYLKIDSINIETAKVKVEHFVGKRDVNNKTGGRIDIYIWDNAGNSISIENKIDACDQEAQIERYVNHNKERNTVYYLTLDGKSASNESSGDLIKESDYYTISYKKDITAWLYLCLKEAAETPILRESIKQYIVLINKLTQTMNKEEEKELFDVIFNHYEEASTIAANFKSAVGQLVEEIRHEIAERLTNQLKETCYIYPSKENAFNKNSIIWIKVKGKDEMKLFFGLHNFSIGYEDYELHIGIFVYQGNYHSDYETLGMKESDYWIGNQLISSINKDEKEFKVSLTNAQTIKKLHSNKEFKAEFISHIVAEVVEYVNKHYESVGGFLDDITKEENN